MQYLLYSFGINNLYTPCPQKQAYMAYKSRLNIIAEVY